MTEQNNCFFQLVELNKIPKDIKTIIFEYDNQYHKKKLEQIKAMNSYFREMTDNYSHALLNSLFGTPRNITRYFNISYLPQYLKDTKEEDYGLEEDDSDLQEQYYHNKIHRIVFQATA